MADINLGVGGANSATGGYEIDNSLKLEADNSEYMVRTMTSTGNRRTFTLSVWLKRTEVKDGAGSVYGHTFFIGGNAGSGAAVFLRFSTSTTNPDTLQFRVEGGAWNYTNRVFRDTSAWYHIVFAVDTTQATESNRIKLYVNGVQETSFSAISYPSQNTDTQNNFSQSATYGQEIGAYNSAGTYYGKFCGYLAEYNHVDGQQLAPTEFGEYDDDSGIWKPKEYTGTYGTNGFYLDFEDSSSLGADDSGNGNNFTLTNIAAADQATDTPTNNFSVMNPLHNYYNEVSRFTITEGGTSLTGNQSSTLWRGIPSTFAPSNGKWYWEIERGYNGNGLLVGVGSADTGQTEWAELTSIANPSTKAKMMYSYNGGIYGYNSSTDAWQYSSNFNVIGDVQSFAIDLDNGYMYVRHNGAAWIGSGDPSSGSSGTGGIALPWYDSESTVFIVTVPNNNQDCRVNFGGYTTTANTLAYSDSNNYGAFKYEVPTGYYALCTKNLAEYG